MEIYFIPDMKLAYLVTNVGNGNKLLQDSMEFVPLSLSQINADGTIDSSAYQQGSRETLAPHEILMVGLGNYGRRPILFLRTRTDVLIYRVCQFNLCSPKFFIFMQFIYSAQVFRYSRGHLKIRFRKLNHNIILPPTCDTTRNEQSNRDAMEVDDDEQNTPQQTRTIRYFGKNDTRVI